MRTFLDNITFNKHIEMPAPKEVKEKPVRSKKTGRIYVRLMQLVFFIIVLILMWVMIKYGALHFVSFTKGYEYQTWEELIKDYDESAKEGHY